MAANAAALPPMDSPAERVYRVRILGQETCYPGALLKIREEECGGDVDGDKRDSLTALPARINIVPSICALANCYSPSQRGAVTGHKGGDLAANTLKVSLGSRSLLERP
jgi:hypothetical protein